MSFVRPDPSSIPDSPGAYLFRDGDGRVIYVGKARSLRKRLANYWDGPPPPDRGDGGRGRSRRMDLASGEVDALMLEYNLIQQHRPRFNIRYRDDKSYPYLALTVGETLAARAGAAGRQAQEASATSVRTAHAWAIRDTLDALTRVFPVRTCSNAFFDQRAARETPVPLLRHRSLRGALRPRGHGGHRGVLPRATSTRMAEFLAGNPRPVLQRLETRDGRGRRAARSTSRRPSSATS